MKTPDKNNKAVAGSFSQVTKKIPSPEGLITVVITKPAVTADGADKSGAKKPSKFLLLFFTVTRLFYINKFLFYPFQPCVNWAVLNK